ncbi:MAG: multiple antibiotic resistance protein [Cocleimonas sp.]|jgi:multiple antibiotic resistance protein
MFETYILALTTFFATVGPIDIAVVFAGLTSERSVRTKKKIAFKGVMVATGILLLFALLGEALLSSLGITLPALRVAGGILLLLIGIDMVFARHSGGTSATADEVEEAEGSQDISVFPLATPLIAGPGAMGAVILLMANVQGDITQQGMVIAGLLSIMLLTYISLVGASQIHRVVGVTGLQVVTRVFGVILCALAVQFMFDGIKNSGLLS